MASLDKWAINEMIIFYISVVLQQENQKDQTETGKRKNLPIKGSDKLVTLMKKDSAFQNLLILTNKEA